MLNALFIVAILIWSGALAYAARGAVAAFGKAPRRGDPMRANVAAVAIMVLSGSLVRLLDVRDEAVLAALFVAVIGTGFFTLWSMKTYGRGGHA